VVVVGDLVGEVGDLRLDRRLRAGEKSFAERAQAACVLHRAVLEDAFARLEREVEAVEAAVTFFKHVDDPQRLQVVFEAAVRSHALVQRILARVPERRVTEVVRERNGFDEIFVDAQIAGDAACDLRDLEGVGEARAEQIAFVVHEDLGLVLEPAERRTVDDAIAIPLELGARRL
jgi:hypothetical protein